MNKQPQSLSRSQVPIDKLIQSAAPHIDRANIDRLPASAVPRDAARKLKEQIDIWVNEGGAGGDVNR
jgi:hypothetical protein